MYKYAVVLLNYIMGIVEKPRQDTSPRIKEKKKEKKKMKRIYSGQAVVKWEAGSPIAEG